MGYEATSNYGVLGHILTDTTAGINKVFCSLLGPNFLDLFSKHNCCPNELIAPHVCESIEKFCEWLKNGGPEIQDCVSAAVIDVRINVNGIIAGKANVGKCCNIPVSSTDFLYKLF